MLLELFSHQYVKIFYFYAFVEQCEKNVSEQKKTNHKKNVKNNSIQ